MLKRKVKLELEAKEKELKMNLENNYKDLAHTALRELQELIEQYRASGELPDKPYRKYKAVADEYALRMQNYHH